MAPRRRPVPDIDPNSSFTPESFEKELKALAAKAKEDTWTRAWALQAEIYGRVVVLLLLAAASANASVAALSPVYGAIPAGGWHAAVVGAACFAGWSLNLHVRRRLEAAVPQRPLEVWLPVLAAYVPVVQYFLTTARLWGISSSSTTTTISGLLTARWGPLVTEAVTLFPLLAATVACLATELEAASGLDEVVRMPRWIGDALPGLAAWSVFRLMQHWLAVADNWVLLVGSRSSRSGIVAVLLSPRIARQLALAIAYGVVSQATILRRGRLRHGATGVKGNKNSKGRRRGPRHLLWYAVPALVHTLAFNEHLAAAPWAFAAVNRQLQALSSSSSSSSSGGLDDWKLLDRRESLTGYVSVLENHNQGFRVLRCDHSLLGGEWVRFPANPVAEPIYGVFVMLEAVRLVEVPGKAADQDAKALVIGLGIGTAPAALVAHGIDTTVVEIDPVVLDFAGRYFHLPANHTAVVEDAVAFSERIAHDAAGPRFDYIVHDVFTGGAEPIALFTLEFLQNLHTLLTPTGVVAITFNADAVWKNYAGDFSLTPIKAVVHTIHAVFPACRIFREHPREATADAAEDASGGPDFANVVIFCTKKTPAVTFRAPVTSDLLHSETRKHFLVPVHEVQDSDFSSPDEARLVRRNDTEQLALWHHASGLGHWAVMRRVVPARVWELW